MGYKTWASQEVLTSNDVNEFLMKQSVLSFATAATRNSALPAPTVGMTAYLNDAKTLAIHNGTEWKQVPVAGASTTGSFLLVSDSGSLVPLTLRHAAAAATDYFRVLNSAATTAFAIDSSTRPVFGPSAVVQNGGLGTYYGYLRVVVNGTEYRIGLHTGS